MAIASGTMTMAQWAMLQNAPMVEAVTFSLIDNGSILARDVPFTNKQTLVASGVRFEGNLPTPNWSQINAEGVVSIGQPKPYQEVAYILRDYIDVDEIVTRDENNIADPRVVQADAHTKGIAYDFNDKFLNNDHIAGDANSFVGLKYRISNGSTYGVASRNLVTGSAVDLSTSGITAATANQFLELLDTLLSYVDTPNGSPSTVLYMNDVMLRRFRTALRTLGTSGGLNVSMDQFNRTIESYKGCPIYDVGYKADQTTRIIPIVESTAGAASGGNSTSIYAVNYGPGHFHGWQFEPLRTRDLGLLNNGVIMRTMIDWAGGFINDSTHSIARLYDIKLA